MGAGGCGEEPVGARLPGLRGCDDEGRKGTPRELRLRVQLVLRDARSARAIAGQRVRLQGLGKEELNGKIGRVCKVWPGFSRRAVRLDGATSVSVKEENLTLLDDDDADVR